MDMLDEVLPCLFLDHASSLPSSRDSVARYSCSKVYRSVGDTLNLS